MVEPPTGGPRPGPLGVKDGALATFWDVNFCSRGADGVKAGASPVNFLDDLNWLWLATSPNASTQGGPPWVSGSYSSTIYTRPHGMMPPRA